MRKEKNKCKLNTFVGIWLFETSQINFHAKENIASEYENGMTRKCEQQKKTLREKAQNLEMITKKKEKLVNNSCPGFRTCNFSFIFCATIVQPTKCERDEKSQIFHNNIK